MVGSDRTGLVVGSAVRAGWVLTVGAGRRRLPEPTPGVLLLSRQRLGRRVLRLAGWNLLSGVGAPVPALVRRPTATRLLRISSTRRIRRLAHERSSPASLGPGYPPGRRGRGRLLCSHGGSTAGDRNGLALAGRAAARCGAPHGAGHAAGVRCGRLLGGPDGGFGLAAVPCRGAPAGAVSTGGRDRRPGVRHPARAFPLPGAPGRPRRRVALAERPAAERLRPAVRHHAARRPARRPADPGDRRRGGRPGPHRQVPGAGGVGVAGDRRHLGRLRRVLAADRGRPARLGGFRRGPGPRAGPAGLQTLGQGRRSDPGRPGGRRPRAGQDGP